MPPHGSDATITAILGPTNTGKTHYAIERMLARQSGIIGLPLRLLAREIFDRICTLRPANEVALITGEEKIVPSRARYYVCTVEAMPLDQQADFVAIDEIQLCADLERGHVFTNRLLNARGRYETLFLGSDTMRQRIAMLVPEARFENRVRYSTLSYAGSKKISRLRPRTAIVAFSVDQVYAIAELVRRQRGGAAVVMGALSPRTRNAQVALYQQGDVDYLVATDAIGMGLNMDVDHVAFAGASKFDGRRFRDLMPHELGQIAGRAGRYTKDGSFGVTGDVGPFAPEVVDAIEEHRFKPIEKLMWREDRLQFTSVPALLSSLEQSPELPGLGRAPEAEDVSTLRLLWAEPEVREIANSGARVRLLWDVCQIPDFRKTSPAEHASLISRIFQYLASDRATIPSDWISGHIARLDRIEGEIDTLSKRLAFMRTWTYVANRTGWVEDAGHWRDSTRAVEDRLSDALHDRLTQRFIDRRTSVLMRRLKQKERLVADVNETGEVTVEGEFIGRLNGFRFTADETASADELKTLRSASLSALQAEFARRADKLYLSPDSMIDVTDQGGLMWGSDAIGRVERGDEILAPRVRVFVDDMIEPAVVEKIERRLSHWMSRRIQAQFEPMIAMQGDEAVTGLARGVAFQLSEALGIVPRRQVADDVKALAQEDRAMLRKHGVRFGQHFIFMPALLKPAPTRLRLLLWSLWEGFDEFPSAPPPGHVTIPAINGIPSGYYPRAGYRLCGPRAVRVDMLERLADMLRPMDARAGFEATPDMLSITGCTLDQFAEVMGGLNFEAERGERPKPVRQKTAPEKSESAATETEAASSEEKPEAEASDQSAAETQSLTAETPDSAVAEPAEPSPPADASTEVATNAEEPAEVSSEEAPAEAAAPVEAEPVADATPEPESAAEETAAEPSESTETEAPASTETEVFYVFRSRPRRTGSGAPNRRGQPRQDAGSSSNADARDETGGGGRRRRGKGPRGGAAEAGGGRPPRNDKKDDRGPGKGNRGGKPKGGQKHGREEPKIDPDSPFAILQQLKQR